MSKYFNPIQVKAIACESKKILLIGSAGTGKTDIIVEKLCNYTKNKHTSKKNITSSKILVVTFNSHAITEIKKRLKTKSKNQLKCHAKTFFGLCCWIINDENKNIEFINKKQVNDLIEVFTDLDEFKNCEEIKNTEEKEKEIKIGSDLWNEICKENNWNETQKNFLLKKLNFFFNLSTLVTDTVLYNKTLEKLSNNKNQEKWAKKFNAIFIDELQNVTKKEFQIIEKLLNAETILLCAGDRNQCINEWRKVDEKIFENFAELKNVEEILLQQNYRSSKKILTFLCYLKKINNKEDLLINEFTENDEGDQVQIFKAKNCVSEARWVVEKIEWLMKEKLAKLQEISIAIFSIKKIENITNLLNDKGVKFQITGENKFDKKTINTVNNYWKASKQNVNTCFYKLLEQLSDFKKMVKDLKTDGNKEIINYCRNIDKNDATITSEKKEEIKQLLIEIDQIKAIKETNGHDEIMQILEIILYRKNCFKTPLLNIKLFDLKKKIIDITNKNKDISVENIFKKLFQIFNNKNDCISISTIHKSSGLENEYVFVPNLNSLNKEKENLLYVASSRAKKNLFLSYDTSDYKKNSCFLKKVCECSDVEIISESKMLVYNVSQ